ncbi:hypothetical protein [Flavobacterium sp. T12S277]|uniref:hypothetical protein n=1 Tax=Flavobacterium sp. T12S277 TaxID=3402752 RepID=UPI003AE3A279
MILDTSDAFNVARYITHPLSLVAYLGAIVLAIYVVKNVTWLKSIKSVEPGERDNLLIKLSEKLHLDINSVPEEQRAELIRKVLNNRIITQIIYGIIGISILLTIAYIVTDTNKTSIANPTVITPPSIDSASYKTAQNSFKVIGIELEGNNIDVLIDSIQMSADWKKWLDNKSQILYNSTNIFETLQDFKKQFGYKFNDILYDEKRKLFSFKNGKSVVNISKKVNRIKIPATDPNASAEYSFTTSLSAAVNQFGFSSECFLVDKKGNRLESDKEPLKKSIYLTLKGLNYYIENPKNCPSDVNILEDFSENPMRLYAYVIKKKMPKEFILVRNFEETSDCLETRSPITIYFSTPILKVSCIVIKNLTDAPLTINKMSLGITESEFLRTKTEDKNNKKTIKEIGTIKLAPKTDLVIPASICFTPLDKIKSREESIDIQSNRENLYYGKTYYLESLTVNGFNFPIKQSSRDVISAFYEGKTYAEYGSCPYVYSFDRKHNNYRLEDHILYNVNSKNKERSDTLVLKKPSSKILISEIDPEESFIDFICMEAIDQNNNIHRFYPDRDILKRRDKKYLHLKTGDIAKIEFIGFDSSKYKYSRLISHGYYLTIKKYVKRPIPQKTISTVVKEKLV